jgi:hypothetical protein
MKSLIAILFLINCLAFFMLTHIQRQSELLNKQSSYQQDAPLESPQSIVLLSELSAEQLETLDPRPPAQAGIGAEQALGDPAAMLVDPIAGDELIEIQSEKPPLEKSPLETLSNDP